MSPYWPYADRPEDIRATEDMILQVRAQQLQISRRTLLGHHWTAEASELGLYRLGFGCSTRVGTWPAGFVVVCDDGARIPLARTEDYTYRSHGGAFRLKVIPD